MKKLKFGSKLKFQKLKGPLRKEKENRGTKKTYSMNSIFETWFYFVWHFGPILLNCVFL